MINENNAISLNEVGKIYRIYNSPACRLKQSIMRGRRTYFREHIALKPISLNIPRGHTVGIVGCNGSGKSTLLQIIAGTLTPTSGSLNINGRISALLELGAGFNPAFSGHDNIYLSGSIMGLSKAEIDAKYDEILSFAGLPSSAISQPVSTYSSGMYVRLAFATAIAVSPEILIVDEALAVGDEGFQRKCFARIRALQETGVTILFVSHSARTIIDLCDHAILLDSGELLMQGAPSNVIAAYHNMLFAPEHERTQIRTQIIASDENNNIISSSKPTIDSKKPETITIYPTNGAEITGWIARDAHGNPCTLWNYGEDYTLEYELKLQKPIKNLHCSMMMKTLTGIELAGVLSPIETDASSLKIQFKLTCNLSKGDYFINFGVVELEHGQYNFLHRIVDALHIKVMQEFSPNQPQPTGLIDTKINVHHSIYE
jgi:lipopolysaccharide transport system ATP-binding protein